MTPQILPALITGGVALVVALAGLLTSLKTLREQRLRTLNERFATAADKLGSDKSPAVRLAGVHAMAGLADDWPRNRQTCVDVLCAYLRIPYKPDPGEQDSPEERLAFEGEREVRHTVIRLITAHLRQHALVSWQGLNFDFRGVVFDGGDFAEAEFSGGTVYFADAKFSGGTVYFADAEFSGGEVYFAEAEFSGGTVDFSGAHFSGGTVDFELAKFIGGTVPFELAKFSGSAVSFCQAKFCGGAVGFHLAEFSGGGVSFDGAEFSGGTVDFADAEFSGGGVYFADAEFSGGAVRFSSAEFSGSEIDFSDVANWSHPPTFDWRGEPPKGVLLPRRKLATPYP